jgi:hypothetical protein
MKEAQFVQAVQWPGTVVTDADVQDFESFVAEHFNETRIKFVGCFETLPDRDSYGVSIADTGGRIDAYFLIHTDDIPKFAVKRFAFGMRWVDDVLDNERGQTIYPPKVQALRSW